MGFKEKVIIASILFLVIVASGFWLSNGGRPLNALLLTIHKLIGLATVIFIGIIVVDELKTVESGTLILITAIIGGVFAIALFVSGAILCLEKPIPKFILVAHNISTGGFFAFWGITFYLLLKK